jgi:SPFH domain / Band 7 family
MEQLVALIKQFFGLFRFWVVVSPWELALRVRLGKRVSLLAPGIHFRLPVVDVVYVQSSRLRVVSTDRQTVMTKDKKTVSFAAAVGFEIHDLEKLYRSLHHAEDTIRSITRAALARDIHISDSCDLDSSALALRVAASISLEDFGLGGVKVFITDLMIVKTYRLVGDYAATYQSGTSLNTEAVGAKS